MEDKGEVLYEIGPKYDFIYELTSPTGKKMRTSLLVTIIILAIKIITICAKSSIVSLNDGMFSSSYGILSIVLWVLLIISASIFFGRIIFQVMEYKGIKYKFYNECLTIENNFLNQTKKTIEYTNIKEVEIRRTVMDRILNYGIIIIYTNAEKSYGSATIIYCVKDTQKHYDTIEKIIHQDNKKEV